MCNRFEAEPPPEHQQARSYKNWNPPLLGNLPDNFLRILPQQLDSIKVKKKGFAEAPCFVLRDFFSRKEIVPKL